MDLKKILPTDGPPVEEVLKYVEKYKNEMCWQSLVLVIKQNVQVTVSVKPHLRRATHTLRPLFVQ